MVSDSLCPDCYVPPLLFKLFFWLGYCNSTMNPIIYTCSSREFRRAFLSTLCCTRCHRRPGTPLTGVQLRAFNYNNVQVRGLLRQQNNPLGVERQEDVLLELSRSKKSNSSGSSTFNATSIDHKSSSGGSPTPVDAEESNYHGSNIISSPLLPHMCTSGDTTRSHNIELDTLGGEDIMQIDKVDSKVPHGFGMSPCDITNFSTKNHKHTQELRKSSRQEIENGTAECSGDINSHLQRSQASSVAPTYDCKNECNTDNFVDRSNSPIRYSSASVASILDTTFTSYSLTDSPAMRAEGRQLSGLSTYSLAETISCSDQSI